MVGFAAHRPGILDHTSRRTFLSEQPATLTCSPHLPCVRKVVVMVRRFVAVLGALAMSLVGFVGIAVPRTRTQQQRTL